MKYLTPGKIAEVTGGVFIGNERLRGARVEGAGRDDREVKPDNLFVCIRGTRVDGHSFANRAFELGASCCLAEQVIPNAKGPYVLVESTLDAIKLVARYYRRRFIRVPVVGIAGSYGKTTAKELIAAALGAKYSVHKTLENQNNELGVPLTLLAVNAKHGVAVVEMGIDSFGEMSRLADMVRPDILVMTSIGYVHLDTLGDLEGVLRAKSEVFRYMKPSGVAVMRCDDKLLRDYDPGMRKITYGFDEQSDFRADNIRSVGTRAVKCDIISDSGRFPVTIKAYGRHLASLAPAAAAVGRVLGLSDGEICRGLVTYTSVGGRANVLDTGYITIIDDCYNANPHSVSEALVSMSELPGRHVAILGDMFELGGLAEPIHKDIGALALSTGVASLICHGEKAVHLYEGYTAAGGREARYFPDKAELISALPGMIRKGDAVLIKASHGMRFEEILDSLRALCEI